MTYLTEEFLKILSISSPQETTRIVTMIFIAVLLMTSFLFAITLLVQISHKFEKHFAQKKYLRFTDWTISYLLDTDTVKPEASLIDQNILKQVILDLCLVLKGIEKGRLLELYRTSGFWSCDLELINSPYSHRRLKALVNLDQWQICLGLPNLRHLLSDENIQVRQLAFKNISRTKLPDEAQFMVTLLPQASLFYSTLYEVISRLSHLHRELIISLLSVTNDDLLKSVIAKVIGDKNILEGVEPLLKLLQLDNDTRISPVVIESLGKIGDPRGLPMIESYLSSGVSKERLSALKALYLISPGSLKEKIHFLVQDPSSEVKSWATHYGRFLS